MTIQDLELAFPEIRWREPIRIKHVRSRNMYWCCRACIAIHGLRERELDLPGTVGVFRTEQACRDHIVGVHPAVQA